MKIRGGYLLRQIANQTYLLPYGQAIADHKRDIKLNESGILLWNALQKNASEEVLVHLLMDHYNVDGSDLSLLREDIQLFKQQLIVHGILYDDAQQSFATSYFKIANLVVAFDGPRQLLHPSLFDFSCDVQPAAQIIHLIFEPPSTRETGYILICTNEITICENETHYLFYYPDALGLLECRLTKDGTQADFYCTSQFSRTLIERIFHAIRFTFLIKAQAHGLFAIHSASLLYKERAWLFSGSSGTGKSTHTALWQKLFQTSALNGDLNLIGIVNNQPYIYGIPWCGTSGIYTHLNYPLGGVVFLKQHSIDEVVSLSEDEKQLFLTHRMISPTWKPDMLDKNLSFASRLADRIQVFCLNCTKEDSAAILIKQEIDQHTDIAE
jgi:hypothetical protein